MTKFEEELSSLPVSKSTNYTEYWNKAQLLTAFKDWQPQQALPVVPECVAKDVKRLSLSTLADWNVAVSYISKETLEWLSTTGNINIFLGKSWTLCSLKINGFKVEKPQLFYLKNKIELEDVGNDLIGYLNLFLTNGGYLTNNINRAKKFTQQEIDSMETGSYEQIEVTE